MKHVPTHVHSALYKKRKKKKPSHSLVLAPQDWKIRVKQTKSFTVQINHNYSHFFQYNVGGGLEQKCAFVNHTNYTGYLSYHNTTEIESLAAGCCRY